MPRKAKPTHHSSKQLAERAKLASANVGGGSAGLADRRGGAAGHSKYQCPHCGTAAPSIPGMKLHWEAKHPKIPFEEDKVINLREIHGDTTTEGIMVRGTKNKEKIKKKGK
eukprot:TRINITY_DN20359_c0_g1_i1.p2 TRINITY_DN20359_c0_g1~~TRINITY_DN20359_c0_g1_i1.p2  ORF type:complete len:111 (+),score=44.49 TRINITY_DN20359_c0_g1_i1:150-482(+)